jgi:chorismate mutase
MNENEQKKLAIRSAIDQIDHDIVELLARRLKMVKMITRLKFGEKITDKNRELEIVTRAKYKASIRNLDKELVSSIFELILLSDRKEQKKIIK